MNEHVFVAQPYTPREARLVGWGAIVFGLVMPLPHRSGFDNAAQGAIVLGMAIAAIAYGVLLLRRGARPQQTVVVNGEGVRVDERPVIAWTDIDALRASRRGVVLMGGGRRLATLSCDLDDPALAAGLILKQINLDVPEPPRTIAARCGWAYTAAYLLGVGVFVAIGIWLVLEGMWIIGGVVLAVCAWWVHDDSRKWVHRVDFDDAALRLRYPFSTRVIPRSELRSVDVIVEKQGIFAVAFLGQNRHVALRVPGVDPFLVYAALRHAYPRPVA